MDVVQIGREELAVLALLQTVEDKHDIRSAFTRSAIPGIVYVEGRLGVREIELLRRTPGIKAGRPLGIRRSLVEPCDYSKTLTMRNTERDLKIGDWIIVNRGLYKEDVGLVNRVHGWGVTVLLVPRLPADLEYSNNKKRKATYDRPTASLFRPHQYETSTQLKPKKIDADTYTMGELVLEHGLLSKDYEFSSVRGRPTSLSYKMFEAFESSQHPSIRNSPCLRPREWSLTEGDTVYDGLTKRDGLVATIHPTFLEVDFGEEGLRPVSWRHTRKKLSEGDNVTVTAGMHSGKTGWVVSVTDHTAIVVEHRTEGNKSETCVEVRQFNKSGWHLLIPLGIGTHSIRKLSKEQGVEHEPSIRN